MSDTNPDLLQAEAAAKAAAEAEAAANAKANAKTVRARVLQDCEYGSPNDIVQLPEAQARAAEAAGLVDTNKAAVAYAQSLAN
jgi:hypothetical protein